MAVAAKVVHILGRTGTKGITRVRCNVIDESERNKVLIRNVLGPVRVGDILMVRETEMESVGELK